MNKRIVILKAGVTKKEVTMMPCCHVGTSNVKA
jgi:hypothetical protein